MEQSRSNSCYRSCSAAVRTGDGGSTELHKTLVVLLAAKVFGGLDPRQ